MTNLNVKMENIGLGLFGNAAGMQVIKYGIAEKFTMSDIKGIIHYDALEIQLHPDTGMYALARYEDQTAKYILFIKYIHAKEKHSTRPGLAAGAFIMLPYTPLEEDIYAILNALNLMLSYVELNYLDENSRFLFDDIDGREFPKSIFNSLRKYLKITNNGVISQSYSLDKKLFIFLKDSSLIYDFFKTALLLPDYQYVYGSTDGSVRQIVREKGKIDIKMLPGYAEQLSQFNRILGMMNANNADIVITKVQSLTVVERFFNNILTTLGLNNANEASGVVQDLKRVGSEHDSILTKLKVNNAKGAQTKIQELIRTEASFNNILNTLELENPNQIETNIQSLKTIEKEYNLIIAELKESRNRVKTRIQELVKTELLFNSVLSILDLRNSNDSIEANLKNLKAIEREHSSILKELPAKNTAEVIKWIQDKKKSEGWFIRNKSVINKAVVVISIALIALISLIALIIIINPDFIGSKIATPTATNPPTEIGVENNNNKLEELGNKFIELNSSTTTTKEQWEKLLAEYKEITSSNPDVEEQITKINEKISGYSAAPTITDNSEPKPSDPNNSLDNKLKDYLNSVENNVYNKDSMDHYRKQKDSIKDTDLKTRLSTMYDDYAGSELSMDNLEKKTFKGNSETNLDSAIELIVKENNIPSTWTPKLKTIIKNCNSNDIKDNKVVGQGKIIGYWIPIKKQK